MKILNKLSLFVENNKKIEQENNYNDVLNEIIDDTIIKKKDLHIAYCELIQKLWLSDKPTSYKTILAKYILGRLSRESERIFLKASVLALKLCPTCSKNYSQYKVSERIH